MFPAIMSNSTSLSEEASCVSSGTRVQDFGCTLNPILISTIDSTQHPQKLKKRRNLPGNPDPDAEVIALSPKTLMATNRFVCEICNKGFQRDQNLQLHRRGHNLPWKLKQKNNKEIIKKRAYVCPEPTCVHHHPSRALGDLTGIKKHFCRKHGEKKWKCDKCEKIYAVQSDWKAHSKTCGTREYRCDCGTLFSRKDSFITHRAFCDALAQESARLSATNPTPQPLNLPSPLFSFSTHQISLNPWDPPHNPNPNPNPISSPLYYQEPHKSFITSPYQNLHVSTQQQSTSAHHLSATALLQKAATFGAQPLGHVPSTMAMLDHVRAGISPEYLGFAAGDLSTWQKSDRLTRDFLGLTGDHGNGNGNGNVDVSVNVKNLLSFTGGVEYLPTYDRDHSLLKPQQGFGFAEPAASETWGNC